MAPTSNLMPLLATLVVFVYAAGVILRGKGAPWYEWAGAVAGLLFAAWFWLAELRRVRRRGRRS
jgi:drug/metabolite transporter (DMT)-like permease